MDLRPLYDIVDPDNPNAPARIFRVVHHAIVAAGIAIMLAETAPPVQAEYGRALAVGFYIVAAFFCAEYILRLIAAPGRGSGPGRANCLAV